jgi:hypothetical protein
MHMGTEEDVAHWFPTPVMLQCIMLVVVHLQNQSKKEEYFSTSCWVIITSSSVILLTATAGFLNKYHQQKIYKKC